MTKVHLEQVTLTADRAVEIEPGLMLPPGRYQATKKQLLDGAISRAPPQYSIVLSEEKIVKMARKPNPQVCSAEFDVTKFVTSGALKVRRRIR
jgi:hypothetical protein